MAISKERKDRLVAEYKALIEQSNAVFLADYSGMNVKKMEGLRAKISEADGAFYVTKNTLLRIALQESGQPVPDELLNGPVGTGFALGEVPPLAKTLMDFAKGEDMLSVKGGIMDSTMLTTKQIEDLANLPSLDQLRAQILGLINGPAQGIVSAVTNGVRQVINVVDAYAKSGDEESEAEAAA